VAHYAPPPELATETWRTRTLIASTIAALELLALIAITVVVLGKGWFQHERAASAAAARHRSAGHATTARNRPAKPTRPHVPPARPMLTRAETGVLVLNGNGQNGAAGAEAGVLRADGYHVTGVGNAKRADYAASIVMYRPGYDREAARLARELHIPIVTALDGVLASQLKGAEALLIVGR
jgi:hypothetical protein